MKTSDGEGNPRVAVKVWQMGNACKKSQTVPCFRVEPDTTNYGTDADKDKKVYCLPWEEREKTVQRGGEPRCFCWCCFCTCSLKSSGSVSSVRGTGGSLLDIAKYGINDQRVSAEKVKRWMFDFESLITDEVGKALFESFLRHEFSDENLKFWSDVERMKSTKENTARYILIRRIYREYVQPRSINEINIEAWIRKSIEDNIDQPDISIFDPAQTQVYLLMYRQSWPRFLASSAYKNLLLTFPV
ncbi:regulator of G-protein signaling 13-like [Rhopilema esculentum]|uniref:regulator of G-protein signaling 13-like n=1 Tax=Rhopilema esculentum TaxID=499914 RepID=UPI0031D79461